MTFKRLIIGEIPHDLDINEDLILSDLCFSKIEDLLKLKSELKLPDTLEKKELNIQNIIDLADNFSLELAKKYSLNFNEYSIKFWKTIYFPYLYVILTILNYYEETISNIISKNSNKLKVKITTPCSFLFKSEDDFLLNFNLQTQELIVSEMIRIKYLDCFELEYFEPKHKIEDIENQTIKNKIGRILDNLFPRVERGYGINFSHKIILHLFLYFKRGKNINQKAPLNNVNTNNSNVYFFELIDKLIPHNLKNIDLLIKNTNSKFLSRNKIRLASNKIYFNTEYKINIALSEESGEIIIGAQHGGHIYGSYPGASLVKEIEYSKRFITWGWSNIDNNYFSTMIPLPSPLLSKYINLYRKKSEFIIIVSTCVTKVPLLFEDFFASSIQKSEYIKLKLSLISKFENHKDFNKIRYRPYSRVNNHFKDTLYLKQFFPQLKVLNTDFHKEILKCKLLILDHPGTTWNIAMVSNTPLFLFFNLSHWNLSKEAKLHLDNFKKLGIYHETSDSLIKQYNLVNKIGIHEWWNSEEIQALRYKWISKYAKAERFWIFTWINELNKI